MKMICAVLVLAICMVGVMMTPQEAEATHKWRIRVDNWGNPDKPDWWKTDGDIKIHADTNSTFYTNIASINGPTGVHNFDRYILNSTVDLDDVNYIELCITGGYPDDEDMFNIDQIEIFDKYGNLHKTFGADNMVGWCLSQDPDDGGTAECGYNDAVHCKKFTL